MGYDFQALPPRFSVQLSVVLSCGLANSVSASSLFSLAKVQISSASTDDCPPPRPKPINSAHFPWGPGLGFMSSPRPPSSHALCVMVRGTLPPPSGLQRRHTLPLLRWGKEVYFAEKYR